MATLSVNEYLDLVRLSGLVEHDRLESAIARLDNSANESGIAGNGLVTAGLLTAWQDRNLRDGRHKGFFLGKYKLLDHLGTGGMGSVYLAEHAVMHHRVAIKVLPRQRVHQSSYLERFIQEARAAARLDHPNVVRAFDVDQEGDNHYIVMDYVDGVDLEAVVRRDGPLSYARVADYSRQAAAGLAHAHDAGLIHRDIKPGNLLVDHKDTVRILDLGLARFTDEAVPSLTMEYDEKIIGTVNYLSPEQALNSHQVDTRADIYSLGCTMYFMLTGGPPFPDGTLLQRAMQHQTARPAHPRKLRPDVPEDLVAICERMMEKSPDRRFQTAHSAAEALAAWSTARGAATSPGRFAVAAMAPATAPTIVEELTLAPLDSARGAVPVQSAVVATAPPRTGEGSRGAGSKLNTAGKSTSGTESTLVSGSGNTKPPVKNAPRSGTKHSGTERRDASSDSAAGKSSVLTGSPGNGSPGTGSNASKSPTGTSVAGQSGVARGSSVQGSTAPKVSSKSATVSSLMDELMADGDPVANLSSGGGGVLSSRKAELLGAAATGVVLSRPKYQTPKNGNGTNYAQVATYSLLFLIFAGALMAGLVLMVGYSATETLNVEPPAATKSERRSD